MRVRMGELVRGQSSVAMTPGNPAGDSWMRYCRMDTTRGGGHWQPRPGICYRYTVSLNESISMNVPQEPGRHFSHGGPTTDYGAGPNQGNAPLRQFIPVRSLSALPAASSGSRSPAPGWDRFRSAGPGNSSPSRRDRSARTCGPAGFLPANGYPGWPLPPWR